MLDLLDSGKNVVFASASRKMTHVLTKILNEKGFSVVYINGRDNSEIMGLELFEPASLEALNIKNTITMKELKKIAFANINKFLEILKPRAFIYNGAVSAGISIKIYKDADRKVPYFD